MLGCRGSRISHHFRECDLHFHLPTTFRFGYSGLQPQSFQLSFPCPLKPCWGGLTTIVANHNRVQSRSCCSATPPKPRGEIPLLFNSLSQQEDEREMISDGVSSVAGGIVALGKFDALHIGHRELAIQASRAGPPFLLSFVGMAKVLGWEPRPPIVATCDRKRVLSSWVSYCCNMVPEEFHVEFSSVRHLSPQQFVEKLSKELRVRGVVAGENYRFGYKAAGDALELIKLCEEYGMEAYIIKSVMDKNSANVTSSSNPKERGQVSSTRVREALAVGDMAYVSELLGRQHRLILKATDQERFAVEQHKVSAPKSCLLNLAPKEGLYEKCSLLLGQENVVQCRVVIDKKFVHVETDYDGGLSDIFGAPNSQFLPIEFGDSRT
ncbi:FAD synthetase 1, chloroplastic-like isoform X1 [Arachis stenosperma]|uniref:FAD synthetase 1, chloroplastic-like isoform X1 n=1 Tax=Arachis stenosperma TaxID=217475 RepID=UPI0025AD280A|nr:FAD synthetase 1, chloroplastic-like isoform X1 [Arachis stenosperma]